MFQSLFRFVNTNNTYNPKYFNIIHSFNNDYNCLTFTAEWEVNGNKQCSSRCDVLTKENIEIELELKLVSNIIYIQFSNSLIEAGYNIDE